MGRGIAEKIMEQLQTDLLVREHAASALDTLREDIEDALKEYGELDLLVELIQNALDALDARRYRLVCAAAGLDPDAVDTVMRWNSAVVGALSDDFDLYSGASTATERALLYQQWTNYEIRRAKWWTTLAVHFAASAEALAQAARSFEPRLSVTVLLGDHPVIIEIEDNGVGMTDIPRSFMHKISEKRTTMNRPRRLGVRGNHGWGLTAVLGFSRRVEVLSRTSKGAAGFRFESYADFAKDAATSPANFRLDLDASESSYLSARLRDTPSETGTHLRVQLAALDPTALLGNTLQNYSRAKFRALLQLYTPIGQVNDYVLHPAFHTFRKGEIRIDLRTVSDTEHVDTVDFDFFRFSGHAGLAHYDFAAYVNAGWPRGVSVHTIHRVKRGEHVFVSAADIQPADWVHQLEDDLRSNEALPALIDENGEERRDIPRGFQFALSGGMRSELVARPPRSTTAAFRGVVLSETARPTLGRKHVLDQRSLIPRVASAHELEYDDLRKKLRATSEPPPATPAAARWRREFHQDVRTRLENQPPLSEDLALWAGGESLEARVMLVFAELLGRGVLVGYKVLRVHLQDIYDFSFLYQTALTATSTPSLQRAVQLNAGGYAVKSGTSFVRYGIGEFKNHGEDLLDDFDDSDPRKMPDTPDLLVCWDFDEQRVEELPWVVEPSDGEFHGQTHTWRPQLGVRRERPLAVISLSVLLDQQCTSGRIRGAPGTWPDLLPPVYY
jgi:hypothetical protein